MTTRLLLLALALAGCTSPRSAARRLRSDGFTDVRITGYAKGYCTEDEDVRTGFVANRGGKSWKGQVCKTSLERGMVVRFEELGREAGEE